LFGISVVLVEPGSYPTHIFTHNARYARDFDNTQSPYFHFSQKLRDIAQKNIRELKCDPEHVAALIERIVNDPHPQLRYVSDLSSWLRMVIQKILPPRLMAAIFRRFIYANK